MQLPEIEVERKFFIENKDELEKRLIDTNGITRVACQNFTDSYYDLSNRPTITLKDNWLRYRECEQNGKIIGTWQLKKPTSRADQSFIPNKSSIYQEVEGLNAIRDALLIAAKNQNSDDFELNIKHELSTIEDSVEILHQNGFECFASFSTQRSTWNIACDKSCEIASLKMDLDVTNFSHKVGEVEAIVYVESSIETAQRQIQSIMESFNLVQCSERSFQQAEGKLERYLRENRPEHFDACVQAGIL